MQPIHTERLELVAATVAHLDAELASSANLGERLRAEVPPGWPPGEYDRQAMEFFREQLVARPDAEGWYAWYALHPGPTGATLVASGGYFGPPREDGTVEIGYSVVPSFQRQGYATELVAALVAHALSFAAVRHVIAHTRPENMPSMKVLDRCGFVCLGPGEEAGTLRFAWRASDASEGSRPATIHNA